MFHIIANKITKPQKCHHNILQGQLKMKQKYEKKDIHLEERQQIIDELRLI